jgi:hypothetical protein
MEYPVRNSKGKTARKNRMEQNRQMPDEEGQ